MSRILPSVAKVTSGRPGAVSPFVFPHPQFELPVGRPQNTENLVIKRGFDGRTPEEARAIVQENLSSDTYLSYDPGIVRVIDDCLRRLTVATNNAFVPGPLSEFLRAFPGARITLQGTMSGPGYIIRIQSPRANPKYFSSVLDGLKPTPVPNFVIAESRIRLTPPGVAVRYLPWKMRKKHNWDL